MRVCTGWENDQLPVIVEDRAAEGGEEGWGGVPSSPAD